MRKGNIDLTLKSFLIDHRKDGSDFERECMEMFRWYFYHLHPEENVLNVSHIPLSEKEIKVRHFVEQTYLRVLKRGADSKGKANYIKLIIEGKIKENDLETIFKDSKEYKKFK